MKCDLPAFCASQDVSFRLRQKCDRVVSTESLVELEKIDPVSLKRRNELVDLTSSGGFVRS